MAEFYERKSFHNTHLEDYINLEENPLQIDFIQGKNIDGYYLGLYFNELANEFSKEINCLSSLVSQLRNSDSFFTPESKVQKRLDYIQAKLNQY